MTTGRTRHLAAVAVTVLLSVTVLPIARPAAVHATSTTGGLFGAAANATVGGMEILQGRAISNRVFTNVDAEEQEVAATYERYIAEAQRRLDAAVAANDPTLIERSQRVIAMLEQERSTKNEILQGMRQNAYDAFRRPEFRRIIAAVADAGPVRRIFDGARTELVDLSSKLGDVRAGLQGRSGISIVQLQTYTAQIERWRTVWSMVSGPSGRNLTALADRATAGLRRATQGLGQVDAELADTQAGLQALSQAVQDLKTVRVRPRGGGFFGFVTSLLGIDTSLIDRLRALIRPRV
ncbi:MAG: hypothetical protein MUE78_00385, partial [Ilumatobacteraceae bacterium]|nr:hypothetical protein [Ilumatobacteraceae bacterium]